jgi:ribosome-associated protein
MLLSTILASLDDDKAEDVLTIPLAGKSDLADHMVIASGRSSRQVQAIADKLAERIKAGLGIVCRTEGGEVGDWVLIDAGDVIVHVFRPEVRDFYQLEKMWMPQPDARRAGEVR